MATYWVSSSVRGAGSGADYANAIGTLDGGIALCTAVGDILNVVNDGNHTWPTTETDIPSSTAGTSFTNYGTLIRGTDTSGNPEQATVLAVTPTTGSRRLLALVSTTGYVILRNLTFDAQDMNADTSAYTVARYNGSGADPGPVRFEGCALLGGATGVAPAGSRRLIDIQTAPAAGVDYGTLSACYLQNAGSNPIEGAATLGRTIDGCLFYNDVATSGDTFFTQALTGGTGGTLTFTANTIYESIGNNTVGIPLRYDVSAGLDAGTVTVKDNLLFVESSHAAPVARFFVDATAGAGATATDDIDYNVLLGGPSVESGDLHADGWYSGLWDVSPANDQYDYEVAEASVFVDTSSTFAWDALGNGAMMTLLKDLRPVIYTAASSTGGVVGALPAGQTDLSVTNTPSRTNPSPGDTVTFTIVAANTGTTSPNTAITALLPSGVTYVSSTVTVGSYDDSTGIWTIGSMLDAASETLVITATVDAGTGGSTITLTATISGDLTDPSAGNDSAAATLTVYDVDDVGNPDGEAVIPVIDTLPIFAPDLKLKLNMRLATTHNRTRRHYARRDVEDMRWREFSTKRIELSTNTTKGLNLGGVQRGQYLFMVASNPVQLSLSNSATNIYWPNATVLVLSDGDFEIAYLKNPSTTVSSTVFIGVSD